MTFTALAQIYLGLVKFLFSENFRLYSTKSILLTVLTILVCVWERLASLLLLSVGTETEALELSFNCTM